MKELVQILKNTRQHLMTGVSHMIPFVVAGGILLAVSVMLYGKGAVPDGLYFLLPLIDTVEFSLRMRRREYSLDAYRSVLADQTLSAIRSSWRF